MGWHYDHQKMTRNMSTIVICLQEAEEGGDFEMKGQPSIKLKTGEAILFPSGPPNQHRSKEVLKGIKYSVNILISHKENVLCKLRKQVFRRRFARRSMHSRSRLN